jgi:hypothetical protein
MGSSTIFSQNRGGTVSTGGEAVNVATAGTVYNAGDTPPGHGP